VTEACAAMRPQRTGPRRPGSRTLGQRSNGPTRSSRSHHPPPLVRPSRRASPRTGGSHQVPGHRGAALDVAGEPLGFEQREGIRRHAVGRADRAHVGRRDRVTGLDVLDDVQRATKSQALTLGLARATVERLRDLVTEGAITRQDFDERQAAFEVARANAAAAGANVERLSALKRFGQVVAPFAGVVTVRNVDTGALVAAGGGASGAGTRPLFTLAQVDTVRVMASVPQSAAASVRVGQAAGVVVQELGGAPIQGRVTRTAQALDPATRTLLVEVQAPNLDRRLMPGMFARVTLTTDGMAAPLLVPANTLIMGAEGPQAALVRDGRVHLAKLVLGRDYGTEVEVLDGLELGAVLVVNPSDEVVEGASVRTSRAPATKPEGAPVRR